MVKRKAFTLVEVIVAAVLTAVGALSLVGVLAGFTKAEVAVREREALSRLVHEKLDEIIATEAYLDQTSGGFDDTLYQNYSWTSTQEETGIEGLVSVSVTVTSPTIGDMTAQTLVFQPADVVNDEVQQQ